MERRSRPWAKFGIPQYSSSSEKIIVTQLVYFLIFYVQFDEDKIKMQRINFVSFLFSSMLEPVIPSFGRERYWSRDFSGHIQ